MRLIFPSFIVPALFFPISCPAADIPQGAHVPVRLVNSITTRTAREGDYVYMRTAAPIAADGQIVVPADTYVQGVVSHVRRSGRISGRAELGIRIETLTLSSGKVARLSPRLSSVDSEGSDQKVVTSENQIQQGGNRETDAARIATSAGAGAAIGGLADRSWKGAGIGAGAGSAVGLASVLLTRGREVELRQGSTIDVVFDRPVSVE
jgi:type IV secretion system protein VirB10